MWGVERQVTISAAKALFRRALLVGAVLACAGCGQKVTQILVEVTSELSAPADVDSVLLRVQMAAAPPQERRVTVTGPNSFPIELPVFHDAHRADELTITVEAWSKGKARGVPQTKTARFSPKAVLRVTFVLAAGLRPDGGAVDAPVRDAHAPGPDLPITTDVLPAKTDVALADAQPTVDATVSRDVPPEAAVCPAGCACNRTCGAGGCTCSAGCPCSLTCQPGTDCDIRCRDPRTSCHVQVDEVPKADLFCSNGATCRFVVAETNAARLICADASCQLDCFGSGCDVECYNGARCLTRCAGGGACALSRCWSGPIIDCGDGVFACGRTCP